MIINISNNVKKITYGFAINPKIKIELTGDKMTESQKKFNDILDIIDDKMNKIMAELKEIDVFSVPIDEIVETEWLVRTQNYLDDVSKACSSVIWATASSRVRAELTEKELAFKMAQEKIDDMRKV